ncbi:hypothetical protein FACS1894182_12960 [Bacteroidia bacterium]|nr:hypothetical protein FACS1894182_12960 [Bacteroidia bacterium]
MKTLSKIKLNQFCKDELDQRQMNALRGGCCCNCDCSCSVGCALSDLKTSLGTLTADTVGYNNSSGTGSIHGTYTGDY